MEADVVRRIIGAVLTLCLLGPAKSIDLIANRAVDFVGTSHNYATVEGKEGNWEQTEMTSGLIDFGPMPENTPGYGWLTGIGYVVPPLPSVSLDGTSRVHWNSTIDCGVPLSGRPDCALIN